VQRQRPLWSGRSPFFLGAGCPSPTLRAHVIIRDVGCSCSRMQTTFDPSYEAGPAHIELRGEDERCNKRKQGEPAALVDHAHADIRIVHRRFKASIACLLLFTCSLCWIVYHAFTEQSQWSASSCAMAWMSPGYIRQDGLNASHSRLAGKYSLWLYREQGWDISSKVRFHSGSITSQPGLRHLHSATWHTSPFRPRQCWLVSTSTQSRSGSCTPVL
jgi:hypothetical protein